MFLCFPQVVPAPLSMAMEWLLRLACSLPWHSGSADDQVALNLCLRCYVLCFLGVGGSGLPWCMDQGRFDNVSTLCSCAPVPFRPLGQSALLFLSYQDACLKVTLCSLKVQTLEYLFSGSEESPGLPSEGLVLLFL